MRSLFPMVRGLQEDGRVFSRMMLATLTLNARAIEMHESPEEIVYSIGGRGVQVGARVGVSEAVGVRVIVGVCDGVGVSVDFAMEPVELRPM